MRQCGGSDLSGAACRPPVQGGHCCIDTRRNWETRGIILVDGCSGQTSTTSSGLSIIEFISSQNSSSLSSNELASYTIPLKSMDNQKCELGLRIAAVNITWCGALCTVWVATTCCRTVLLLGNTARLSSVLVTHRTGRASHCHTLTLSHFSTFTLLHCHTLALSHSYIVTLSHCHFLALVNWCITYSLV